ncbi:MAG: NAD-dependent epimerase/dehydratase family protein [Pseudomonadota bacterium]
MSQTILLTGITGFIAKRIAFDLLSKGYTVKGSLRSNAREAEVRAAVQGAQAEERLSFVTLDLNSDEGWEAAMVGVDAVFHTASPFPLTQPKDEAEIITPAVEGTLRAMKAAQKAGVTRVVLTASMVSVMHNDYPASHTYTSADWTDVNDPSVNAYAKSKTLAEKAAWEFTKAHPEMQLTTVHPGLVCGTPTDANYGSSLEVVERILSGKDPMQPDLGLPMIDVEDVSKMHILAFETPDTIGQRLLGSESWWTFPQMAETLKAAYPTRKISTRIAPRFMLKLLSLFDPAIKTILPQVGKHLSIDASQTEKLLGLTFIPGKEAILKSAAFIDQAK